MNKERRVVEMITNCRAKILWQVTEERYGVKVADRTVAERFDETVEIVKEARQYW